MKIGILSYHQVRNFGAVLQNYALQIFIDKIPGANVETIDYRCKFLDRGYNHRMLHDGGFFLDYSIKDIVKYIRILPYYKKREKKFDEYLKHHIKTSKQQLSRENISSIAEKYDYFVVGSDQVWNLEIINDDYTYFLDFVEEKNRKISYAASVCWKYVHSKNKTILMKLLNDFKAISVREAKDANKLSSIVKNTINVNIDPTLLLTTDEWKSAEEQIKKPQKYILFFELLNASVAADLAKKKAEELGIPVIYISSDDKPWKYHEFLHIHSINPGQFITLIRNSDYVYTNSFHGVMFSLLNHKPFYCQQTNGDRRMEDALELVGLSGCYIRDDYGIDMQCVDNDIWSSFEREVYKQRCISNEYFMNNLEK